MLMLSVNELIQIDEMTALKITQFALDCIQRFAA